MALLSVIRRWHYRDHLSIREIVRRTGLSRNTIRKYLRSETIEPQFKVPERPSKLDPFAERLSAWLQREMVRSRKQKRTVKQLHADLVSLGYDGSYGRVAAFARAWRDEYRRQQQMSGRGTFVPLLFAPGEAFQFDWSEDWAIIAGVRTKLQVAHFKLSHSRAFGEQDVEQADPVATRNTGAQMGEGVGELQRSVHFEQQVGNADGRQATVKVQHQVIDPVRRIGGQAIDAQRPVLDAAFRDRTVARGATEPGEAIGETGLAVREPDMRIGRYGQLRSMRDFHRYEDVAKVTVPVRAVEPDVTRAQRVAQMEHDRDFPEARIIVALRPQLTPPFGMWAQEIVGRRERVFGGDGDHRVQQGARSRRGLEMEAAQHTRGIATEAVIPLIDMRQRIIAKRVRQNPGRRDEAGEMVPSRRTRDRILQRRAVAMRFEQRLAKRSEAAQRRSDPTSGFRGAYVM